MSSDRVGTFSYGDPMVDLSQAPTLLERLAGPGARFRPGQYEGLRSLIGARNRALVVQRTGWGKSAVYLIATQLLREAGRGPTVIVSPLVALMRNQLIMASRLDLTAEVIIAANVDEHPRIFESIATDSLDLLLISPERLSNAKFRAEALPTLLSSLGLLVVDEVHCISIWGHDFRPDYRRLGALVKALPPGIPVLGTTATANDNVVRDIEEQLGDDLVTIRGTLERESLVLQVNRLLSMQTDSPGSHPTSQVFRETASSIVLPFVMRVALRSGSDSETSKPFPTRAATRLMIGSSSRADSPTAR